MLKTKQDLIEQAKEIIETHTNKLPLKIKKNVEDSIELLKFTEEFQALSEQYKEAERKLKSLKDNHNTSLNDIQYSTELIAFNTLRSNRLKKELANEATGKKFEEELVEIVYEVAEANTFKSITSFIETDDKDNSADSDA